MRRDPKITSRIMREVRSKNTLPERQVAGFFRLLQVKFKRHPNLIGRPDFLISSAKLVVFCDGDFWHGHSWKERGLRRMEDQFKVNKSFWINKIRNNMKRDLKVNKKLRMSGWKVLRIRESALCRDPTKCLMELVLAFEARKK